MLSRVVNLWYYVSRSFRQLFLYSTERGPGGIIRRKNCFSLWNLVVNIKRSRACFPFLTFVCHFVQPASFAVEARNMAAV